MLGLNTLEVEQTLIAVGLFTFLRSVRPGTRATKSKSFISRLGMQVHVSKFYVTS